MSQHSNLRGCLWMVAGGLLFVAVTVLVRLLGSDMPAVEAAFIRYLIGVILVLPMLWRMRFRGFWCDARQFPHICAARTGAWRRGNAVVLCDGAHSAGGSHRHRFLHAGIYRVGAILIFHEQVKARRMLAIAAGFVGTLIILRPGFQSIEAGSLAQLIAAFFFAGSFLLAKRMTQSESSADILVMLSIFCTLALLPGAIYFWRTPTLTEVSWLALVAVFATAGHYAITRAIAAAPLTVTQPLSFMQLIWAIGIGYWVFDEVPITG